MLRTLLFIFAMLIFSPYANASSADDIQAGKEALKKQDCQSAQRYILPLAESGDVEAQFQMGRVAWCFDHNDEPSQLKWFLLAAEKGHSEGQWRASHFYAGGWSVAKDPERALALTQKAAAQGYAPAEFDLALAYRSGKSGKLQLEQDNEKALYWMTRAATHNKSYIAHQAEFMAKFGKNDNLEESFRLYLTAAEQGDKEAMCKVAEIYSAGKGTARDEEESFRWFSKRVAIAEGVPDREIYKERCLDIAKFEVARRIYEGVGTPKHEKEGFNQLVLLAGLGSENVEKWLQERALLQDVDPALKLASTWKVRMMYGSLYGRTLPSQLCDEAKDMDNVDAAGRTFVIGACYEYGLAGERDLSKARAFYEKAAGEPLNFAPAQKKLGDFFLEGTGVRKDSGQAYLWYSRAANQDYYVAQYAVSRLLLSGNSTEEQLREAFTRLTQAARPFDRGKDKIPRPERGYARAQYVLGRLHEAGTGVPKNQVEARAWYSKSASQGLGEAKTALDRLGSTK